MPVHSVKGQPNCYQWGKTGKIYCGAGAKDKAERQGRAIHATGWKEAESNKPGFITIKELEVGDIFIFKTDKEDASWERFVLKSKQEVEWRGDGLSVWEIVFDPHAPSPVSDIKGVIKSDVPIYRWVNPYEVMLKRRMGMKFDSESKAHTVDVSRSTNKEKKLMAIFEDGEGKKIKTTHFGQRGASDYTKHGDKERMGRYNDRHKANENWNDPQSAGALSKHILWNKPSLKGSFTDYKKRFGLKGDLKVSKSAETFEAAQRFDYGQIIYDTFYGDGNKTFRDYQERLARVNKDCWFNSNLYKYLNKENYDKFKRGIKSFIKRNTREKQDPYNFEINNNLGIHVPDTRSYRRFMIKDKLFLFRPTYNGFLITSIDAAKPYIIKEIETWNNDKSKAQIMMAISFLNRGKYRVFSEYIWAADIGFEIDYKFCFTPEVFFAQTLEYDLNKGKKFKSDSFEDDDEEDDDDSLTPSQKMSMKQTGINMFDVTYLDDSTYSVMFMDRPFGKFKVKFDCSCNNFIFRRLKLGRTCRHIDYVLNRLKFNALSQSQRKNVLRKTIMNDKEIMEEYNFESREDGINFLLLYMKED